ncbi:MAG: hypothetical protein HZA14_13350 [Nitrospirae bacterium]|nr:hypothetical protein [Nitrospirota bacterium]
MNFVFNIINVFFGFLFFPFRNLDPAWGMIWISLVTGLVMLVIFRFTSNQEGIRKAKAKVSAHILEMRLYNHDLGRMLASLGKTFTANFVYLRYMIVPIIFIIIPVLMVLIQVSYRYEHRPLRPGEQAILKAVLKPASPVLENSVTLQAPEYVDIRTPALRIASLNEIYWRISGQKRGVYELDFTVNGKQYKKNLHVDTGFTALSVKRAASFSASLLNHSEPVLPEDSPFLSLQITYPDSALTLMGFDLHWIIWFCIFSVVFGFAFKNVFRVEL